VGFEPGSSRPQADAMTTAPRRTGEIAICFVGSLTGCGEMFFSAAKKSFLFSFLLSTKSLSRSHENAAIARKH
jgi:hypothetical protein